jgi:DNA-binding SARP family transcriptional activator
MRTDSQTSAKPIRIRLLGGIRVERGGLEVTGLGGVTYRGLLALLALRPESPPTREQAIEFIWPGVDLDVGRNRLSTALVALRRVLAHQARIAIHADRTHIWLDQSLVSTDVGEFLERTRLVEQQLSLKERIDNLDELLDFFTGPVAPEIFDDWIVPYQIEIAEVYDRLAKSLIESLLSVGENDRARAILHRYEKIEPDSTTLREMRVSLGRAESASSKAKELRSVPGTSFHLVGREKDESAIAAKLARLEPGHILTLTGVGGVGKSTLVRQVCRSYKVHSVFFCDSTRAYDANSLLYSIALTLGLSTDDVTLEEIALAISKRPPCLLVLDGFEHLPRECSLAVSELALAGQNLRILVTSRRQLSVENESTTTLHPLSCETAESGGPAPAAQSLLLERLRRFDPGFLPSLQESTAIDRIAVRLSGLPLAIELAAEKARLIGIEEVAKGLLKAIPPGDTSVLRFGRLVIDTFRSCSPRAQAIWLRIALFRGPVDAEAVTALTESFSDAGLSELLDRGLFQPQTRTGCLRMYDFYRERLLEELEPDSNDEALTWYLNYWNRWLGARAVDAIGSSIGRAFDELSDHNDDVVHSLELMAPEASIPILIKLRLYWPFRGRVREAASLILRIEPRVANWSGEDRLRFGYIARYFHFFAGFPEAVAAYGSFLTTYQVSDADLRVLLIDAVASADPSVSAEDLVELSAQSNSPDIRCVAMTLAGWIEYRNRRPLRALALYDAAAQLAKTLDCISEYCHAIGERSYTQMRMGFFQEARHGLEESGALADSILAKSNSASGLLGYLYVLMGKYALALSELDRAEIQLPSHGIPLANILVWKAKLYHDMGRYEESLDTASHARQQVIGYDFKDSEIGALAQAAESAIMLGSLQEGLNFVRLGKGLVGPGTSTHARNKLEIVEARLAFAVDTDFEAIALLSGVIERSILQLDRIDALLAIESLALIAEDLRVASAAHRVASGLRNRLTFPRGKPATILHEAVCARTGERPSGAKIHHPDVLTMHSHLSATGSQDEWLEFFDPVTQPSR